MTANHGTMKDDHVWRMGEKEQWAKPALWRRAARGEQAVVLDESGLIGAVP